MEVLWGVVGLWGWGVWGLRTEGGSGGGLTGGLSGLRWVEGE